MTSPVPSPAAAAEGDAAPVPHDGTAPEAPSATGSFMRACEQLQPLDEVAFAEATARHGRLTKPPGALGELEDLGCRLAAIAGVCPPPAPSPAAVAVFAGDHGVVAQGVTPWPQEVTAQMVANFAAGGAAVNVLARTVGAAVVVVDVGVATDIPLPPTTRRHIPSVLDGADLAEPIFLARRVRAGTADLSEGPAMGVDHAITACDVGAAVAAELVAAGARCLVTGDMGIGNTTASAALIAAFTGCGALGATGRGTGIDEATLAHKRTIVAGAVERLEPELDPLEVLARIGGLEHAALVGFIVGGAAAGVPVVIDGVIALAALLVAEALAPGVAQRVVAGHRSTEPGASQALAQLELNPLLDLGLRLGEGSGACLALPLVDAAARILSEMATFDEAGVVDRT